jgi:hypothetical protein
MTNLMPRDKKSNENISDQDEEEENKESVNDPETNKK